MRELQKATANNSTQRNATQHKTTQITSVIYSYSYSLSHSILLSNMTSFVVPNNIRPVYHWLFVLCLCLLNHKELSHLLLSIVGRVVSEWMYEWMFSSHPVVRNVFYTCTRRVIAITTLSAGIRLWHKITVSPPSSHYGVHSPHISICTNIHMYVIQLK